MNLLRYANIAVDIRERDETEKDEPVVEVVIFKNYEASNLSFDKKYIRKIIIFDEGNLVAHIYFGGIPFEVIDGEVQLQNNMILSKYFKAMNLTLSLRNYVHESYKNITVCFY